MIKNKCYIRKSTSLSCVFSIKFSEQQLYFKYEIVQKIIKFIFFNRRNSIIHKKKIVVSDDTVLAIKKEKLM